MAIPAANIDHTLFFTLGIALIVSALVVSAIGLRFESFPPNRLVLAAVIAWFVVLVAGTTTFAVLNARDEQHKKEAEQAAATTETSTTTQGTTTAPTTSSTTSTSTSSSTSTSTPTTTTGGGSTVKISADPTGQLAFQQSSVTASKPGAVKIDFTNQSPVGHDVHVSDSSGKDLGGTNIITGTSTSATVNLQPGKYTFFCSVPGHEAAGMKGTLVVK
jgi:plastocyanin